MIRVAAPFSVVMKQSIPTIVISLAGTLATGCMSPEDNASDRVAEVTAGPTCSVTASPSQGGLDTSFVFTLMSARATQCSYRVDQGAAIAIPCAGSLSTLGSSFGVGAHTIAVAAEGDGGTAHCSTAISIEATPSCQISITPATARVDDTLTASLASQNATQCQLRIDGGPSFDVACNTTVSGTGGNLFGGVGNHLAMVTATDDSGAATICHGAWTIVP